LESPCPGRRLRPYLTFMLIIMNDAVNLIKIRVPRLVSAIGVFLVALGSPPDCRGQIPQVEPIRIPRAGELFESGNFELNTLRSSIRIAIAPDGPVADAPGTAKRGGWRTASGQYPVALASFEDDAFMPDDDPADAAKVKPQALDWDWAPSGVIEIDQEILNRLQESIERTRQTLPERAPESAKTPEEISLEVASERLEAAKVAITRIGERTSETRSAPDDLRQLETSLAQPPASSPISGPLPEDLESLQGMLQEMQQWEQRTRGELQELESDSERRIQTLSSVAGRRTSLNERLAAATRVITEQVTAEEPNRPLVVENQAIAVAAIVELQLLNAEYEWAMTTEKLIPVRREVTKRKLDQVVAGVQELQTRIDDRRKQIAIAEQEKARDAAANADPRVREIARRNAELAEERTGVAEGIQLCKQELDKLVALEDELDSARARIERHISRGAKSQSVGLMLRHQRGRLPRTRWHRDQVTSIAHGLPDISLKSLNFEEELENLPLEIETIHEQIAEANAGGDLASTERVQRMADNLMETRREYLTQLKQDYETWLNSKTDLRAKHELCIGKIDGLQLEIDKHVLWIRSADPLALEDFRESGSAIRSLIALPQWKELLGGLGKQLVDRWQVVVAAAIVLFLAVGMKRQFTRRLRRVSRRRSDFRLSPIVRSMIMTLIQATFLPAMVATLGWLLRDPWNAGSIQDAIARSLLAISPQLFVGSILYRFCLREGLAEKQLGWSQEVTALIRSATGRIIRYCLPLIAVSHGLELYEESRWSDSLGRLAFISAMLMFSSVSFGLLRGIGGCWKRDPESGRSAWVQTFGLWAPLMVLAPLVLAGMAGLGYQYSAVFLAGRLLLTWWGLLGVVAIYHLAGRLIEIAHNRLYFRQVPSAVPVEHPENADEAPVEPPITDNQDVRGQVKGLLHASCIAGFILSAMALWAEVLPAISALDIPLWGPIERKIGDAADGSPQTQLQWVTIGNALTALLILGVTVVLSRNLPGLLEMFVLNRLPFDRGGRYAISIIFRYAVGLGGIMLATRSIGASWQGVQWLVAAMGVGLGFGLQEIFANFISGIIILFERPVRAGDLVTIAGTTGHVHRIQLRATTIMDFDRRELIVPNKKFITDEVINWTLSDPITRVVIPVGIAYGSDTRLAQRTLLRIARQNPNVLKEPRPAVVFSAFAGSSLNFELKVFIPSRETYSDTVHELHMAIDDEFRRLKIEIAFPQQDVHVKGLDKFFQKDAA
jgi:potassium-dependent mechanosensitive channel